MVLIEQLSTETKLVNKNLQVPENGENPLDNYFSEDFCIALDSTTQPVYIIDPETFQMLYCNESLREYLGWNPLGEACHKVVRDLDEPCPDCVARKLYREGINETAEYCTQKGEWVLVRISPLSWRGKELYKLSCFDITERKRLENELSLRNEEYRAIVQQSITGVMRYDIAADTAVVNVDRNLDRVEEYTIFHFRKTVCDSGLITLTSKASAEEILSDICSGKLSRGYDIQLSLERDGLRWCHLDYVLIRDEEGRPYRAVVSFYDNTEQHEKELAYEHWNHRLDALMNDYTVYLGVNLSKNIIEVEKRVSSKVQYMGGSSFTEIISQVERRSVFEEDRQKFRAFFNRERMMGHYFDGGREGVLEYRIVRPEKIHWYRAEIQLASEPSTGYVKASIVLSNVDEELREKERLRNEAQQDSMTEIYNRAAAEKRIREVLGEQTGERCCFLIIDLDDLRNINSEFGHPEGDRALKAIADCMKAKFRKSDIIGRIGGDEFVVLLRNVPKKEQLQVAISGFMHRLSKVKIGPENDRLVCVSVGGAVGTAGMDTFEKLYRQADLALYYVKAMGKNAFKLYESELENREFTYQPRSTATLAEIKGSDSPKLQRLLRALTSYYPLVISANLTKNTYYMLEYKDFATQKARENGNYDMMIEDGASTFHSEDRQSFLDCFQREKLLEAYGRGIREVEHKGHQLGDDGIYRLSKTIGVLLKDEDSGDICEVSFTHVVSSVTSETE